MRNASASHVGEIGAHEGLAKDDSVRAVVYRGAATRPSPPAPTSRVEQNEGHETALAYNKQTAARTTPSDCARSDGGHGVRLLHGWRHGGGDGV